MKKVRTALISVFNKGQVFTEIVHCLDREGVKMYATGGTFEHLRSLGLDAVEVSSITHYPAILGGRVKTLHPLIFGGILARRDVDEKDVARHHIPYIDLVLVDLYPFVEACKENQPHDEIIEKIDIGGVALIRAGAKNYKDVWVVSSENLYKQFLETFDTQKGSSSLTDRKTFALEAFSQTSTYDRAIADYFQKDASQKSQEILPLRYGENPHQSARFEGNLSEIMQQLHGKKISYNNLLDIDAACGFILELDKNRPAFAIIKHNNCCGIAQASTPSGAYEKALTTDPQSAFGGVFISNSEIDLEVAEKIDALFYEVLIAPNYHPEALTLLRKKKTRILIQMHLNQIIRQPSKRTLLNGVLIQDHDFKTEMAEDLNCVTAKKPDAKELEDMLFAIKICKHTKSNAVVLVKDLQLLSLGMGQTSRVDALSQAIEKAHRFGFDLQGAVLASEAFFPFDDCVKMAQKVGVSTFVQPGGSRRDQDSIGACNREGSVMCFTGVRHFKH